MAAECHDIVFIIQKLRLGGSDFPAIFPAAKGLCQDGMGHIDDVQIAQNMLRPPAEIFQFAIADDLARGQAAIGQEEAGIVAAAGGDRGDRAEQKIQGGEIGAESCGEIGLPDRLIGNLTRSLFVDRAGEVLRAVEGADRPAIDALLKARRVRGS